MVDLNEGLRIDLANQQVVEALVGKGVEPDPSAEL